jgi:LmbE family N-acetylglucosaminyl deacetylase
MTTVLSPHLDDAVLSCWHILEGLEDAVVVNVFTASPPPGTAVPKWDRLTGARDPVERMDERRAEDRRALERVGCDAIHLDLLDVQYREDAQPTEGLADRLAGLLEPGTIHAPAALGGHPDHVAVRDAALELSARGWPLVLYADLPHGIVDGWPAWVTGVPGDAGVDVSAAWDGVLAAANLNIARLIPRVRPLDAQMRERKLGALDEYRTQRAALDDMTFVPLDDPRALAFEVSWSVPASALGGAHEAGGQIGVPDAVGQSVHQGG